MSAGGAQAAAAAITRRRGASLSGISLSGISLSGGGLNRASLSRALGHTGRRTQIGAGRAGWHCAACDRRVRAAGLVPMRHRR